MATINRDETIEKIDELESRYSGLLAEMDEISISWLKDYFYDIKVQPIYDELHDTRKKLELIEEDY